MKPIARTVLIGLTAALVAAVPGLAHAAPEKSGDASLTSASTVFGADLSKPVNSDRTCWGGLMGPEFWAQQAATYGMSLPQFVWMMENYYGMRFSYPGCTWWNVGRLPAVGQPATNLGDNVVPFGGGTLTTVRIKTGPVTGRMQVVILRFIRHPDSTDNPGGPFFVSSSQEFTPQPNAVSEIPVNLPVKHELDKASGLYNYDVMALSVLEPDVPVPFWSAGGDPSTNGGILAKYPAWQPGVEQYQDVGALNGAGSVLIQGVVTKADAQVNLPAGAKPAVSRNGKTATVPLNCAPGTDCAGVLRLANRKAAAAAGRTSYGKARFSIAAGQTGTVKVKLSKQARKKLRSGKALKTWANVTMDSGGSSSFAVKLRKR